MNTQKNSMTETDAMEGSYCQSSAGCQTGSLWAICIMSRPYPSQVHKGKKNTIYHNMPCDVIEFDTCNLVNLCALLI